MSEGDEHQFEENQTMGTGTQPVVAEANGAPVVATSVQDLGTGAVTEAPGEATQLSPIESGDKHQSAQYLAESGKVTPEQAAILQNLSQEKAKLISQMVYSGLFSGDDVELLAEMSEEELAQKIKKRELEFLRTGGLLDEAMIEIFLPEVMKDVDKEFEKRFAAEAAVEYAVLLTKDPAEIATSIYLNQDLKLLPQEEFIRLFILNKKDLVKNPGLANEIQERVQQEVQRRLSELRGRSIPGEPGAEGASEGSVEDSPAVQEMKKSMLEQMLRFGMFAKDQLITAGSEAFNNLKDQLITAGSEAFNNLLDLDFMTLFRAFIHGSGSYDVGRGGSLGYEDGGLVRHVGEDELLAKFKKPKELGQAIAMAFLRSKEMQDMKFSVKQEVLDRAVEGDVVAIQEVMKAMVDHLHVDGSIDEKWKALRKGLGEGLYPGVNARLDDEVKKLFVDDRGTELLHVMNLLLSSEGAGTSSKDSKDTRTGQTATASNVIQLTGQTPTSAQPDTKAA